MIVFTFILAITLALAVAYDLKRGSIPNWLTLGSAILALTLSAAFGATIFARHFFGMILSGGLWFIFWQLKFVGGGDQKLMMSVGSMLGSGAFLSLILFTSLAGALQAIIWVIWHNFFLNQKSHKQLWQAPMPYSLAIALGAFVAQIGLTGAGRALWF